jgi:F0F1-type ATP synthase assembly protein I
MAEKGRAPEWVRYSGIGIELVGAVAGFALLGYWLDGRYTPKPWGMVGGLILGLVGGFYNLIRQALQAEREAAEADRARQTTQDSDGGTA